MPSSISTPSTSKTAIKTSFVKATYIENVKTFPTNKVTKGKMKVPLMKVILLLRVRVSAPKW